MFKIMSVYPTACARGIYTKNHTASSEEINDAKNEFFKILFKNS